MLTIKHRFKYYSWAECGNFPVLKMVWKKCDFPPIFSPLKCLKLKNKFYIVLNQTSTFVFVLLKTLLWLVAHAGLKPIDLQMQAKFQIKLIITVQHFLDREAISVENKPK